jgi:hypothetical protein
MRTCVFSFVQVGLVVVALYTRHPGIWGLSSLNPSREKSNKPYAVQQFRQRERQGIIAEWNVTLCTSIPTLPDLSTAPSHSSGARAASTRVNYPPVFPSSHLSHLSHLRS